LCAQGGGREEYKLILVTGMPGSGKSLVSDFLRQKGFVVYSMGDIVREIAEERGVEKTSENLLKIASEIRERYGRDGVAKLMVEKIKRDAPAKDIVIDGVRAISEAKLLLQLSSCVHLIAVHASPLTRFKRILKRRRTGDPSTINEFVYRDLKELSFGLGDVIAISDIIIVNEGSPSEIRVSLDKMWERIRECPRESELKYL
jgi:dephospho-CoA kinase